MTAVAFLAGVTFGAVVSALATYAHIGRQIARQMAATIAVSHQVGLLITAFEQSGIDVERNAAFTPKREIH